MFYTAISCELSTQLICLETLSTSVFIAGGMPLKSRLFEKENKALANTAYWHSSPPPSSSPPPPTVKDNWKSEKR